MWRRNLLLVVLLAGSLGLAALGVYALFVVRLGAGDSYPPYSSLRADPLGTKILHDSFRELTGLQAGRWLKPVDKLAGPPAGTLLLHLGARPWWMEYEDPEQCAALHDFVRRGGTLVVAFAPITYVPGTNEFFLSRAFGATNETETARAARTNSLQQAVLLRCWGFRLDYAEVREAWRDDLTQIGGTNDVGQAFSTDGKKSPLTCRTTLHFTGLDPAWRVLYERRGLPVIMERAVERGRVVLCAEAYPLSNEAMVRERRTELLAGWSAGCTNVWFAESHLGVNEQAGIMTLVNRYGLQGGVLALLLLAGLFVWRQAAPLVPPEDETQGAAYELVGGRQSAEGLVNLLRRGVPPAQLLETCWEEWSRSTVITERKRARVRQALDQARGKPGEVVAAYREACRILAEKEW